MLAKTYVIRQGLARITTGQKMHQGRREIKKPVAGRSLYLVPDGPAAEPGYGVLRLALAQRQRWALGRMVLGGHRQVVLVRPADTTLVLHVLHYPEHVRVCPQTVWPMIRDPRPGSRNDTCHARKPIGFRHPAVLHIAAGTHDLATAGGAQELRGDAER